MIKRLAKRNGTGVVLEQFNPPNVFEIKNANIVSIGATRLTEMPALWSDQRVSLFKAA